MFSRQVDEARNGSYGSLDVVGDGKKESFALVHDALNLGVGLFQVLTIDAFLLGVFEDVAQQDYGGGHGKQSHKGDLPQERTAGIQRFA